MDIPHNRSVWSKERIAAFLEREDFACQNTELSHRL